jgi:tRNA 2-thiouridine synthesizing protein A
VNSDRPPAPDSRTPARGPGPAAPTAQPALPPQPALTLDALGKKCPIPIIMLADRIREVPIGQTIEVLADDPAARTDVPAWCTLKSQEFAGTRDLPVGWSFLVRRCY